MISWPERDYISTLYREILHREPGEGEVAHHARKFDRGAGDKLAARLLTAVLGSDEAKRKAHDRMLGGFFPPADGAAPVPTHVVSCGSHCYAGAMLKRWGLKRFSGPFDWLFSSPAMVRHCIEDDFATFLDRSQYIKIPEEKRSDASHSFRDHAFYQREFGINAMFNHFDPATDKDYSYMQRCVDRWRTVMASDKAKLLVAVTREGRWPTEDFIAMAATIRAGTDNARVVVFLATPPKPGRLLTGATVIHAGPGIEIYRIDPLSALGPTTFGTVFDEVAIARLLHGGDHPLESVAP